MRVTEIGWRRVDENGQDILDLPPELLAKAQARMAAAIEAEVARIFAVPPPIQEPRCRCRMVHTCNNVT